MNQRLLSCLIFAATLILFLTPDSPFFRVLAARVPIISTVGGGGPAGYCGDDGPATSACLNFPIGVAVNGNNNLAIADTFNNRIRQFKSHGTITTVAGNGTPGFCGDNSPAISACLQFPVAVAADTDGNLFITDLGNQRIRKIHHGTITTVAGNGTPGFCGDGGPATSACLNGPVGIAIDTGENLFIADAGNQRIRQVDPWGTINAVAGNGRAGFCGDGGPATDACLNGPTGVALDNNDLFIVDEQNSRVRRVH
jgi:sugar lactone lactonase YvrE